VRLKLALFVVFTLIFSLLLFGCGGGGGGGSASSNIAISISPSSVNVTTNSKQEFRAVITGTNDTRVMWSIQEGAVGGTIVPKANDPCVAVYTAPDVWNTFHIVVTLVADQTKKAVAEVRVGPPLPEEL
jgi:hypothetical protein